MLTMLGRSESDGGLWERLDPDLRPGRTLFEVFRALKEKESPSTTNCNNTALRLCQMDINDVHGQQIIPQFDVLPPIPCEIQIQTGLLRLEDMEDEEEDTLIPKSSSIEEDDEANRSSDLEEIERFYSRHRGSTLFASSFTKLGVHSESDDAHGRTTGLIALGSNRGGAGAACDQDLEDERDDDDDGQIATRTPWDRLCLYFMGLPPRDLREKYMITDSLSDQDIESKFTALSLAFNTDKLTLNDRLELQQRQRDTAEKNIDEDIRQLKTAIGSLNKVCTDAETREMLHRLQKQVDVFRHSSERVSSSAEVYGAVQQEARISRAIEIMLHHGKNAVQCNALLCPISRILADNNLSIAASNSLLGAGGGLSGEAGPNNSSNKANSNRMRSISVINPSGTAVTFGPGTNGASSGSPKLRRASVGVPPASALRSPNPNRRNVVESGQLLPSFQKAIRKQATTVGPARKTSSSGGLRMYGAEGRESCFSTISEHGEVTSGGKFNDSFESRVAGQFAQNEGFRGDSNNNNNNNNHHVANGDILKKSDDFNAIPEYGARNRRSDRVRSTSLIEPVKEEEEDAILEEIDTLALKRDSSPAPHAFRR
ncbi:hypothetical protein TCAL_15770, partial [Tigriopus californicus]